MTKISVDREVLQAAVDALCAAYSANMHDGYIEDRILMPSIKQIEKLLIDQPISERKVMSKAFCNPASHDWRDDVQASDYLNE